MPLTAQQIDEVIATIPPASQSAISPLNQKSHSSISSISISELADKDAALSELMRNPPLPLSNPEFNQQKLKNWVNLHTGEERAIALKIAANIDRKSVV